MNLFAIISLFFFLFSGCVPRHNIISIQNDSQLIDTTFPVYGKLEQVNQHYRFTQFSERSIEGEAWVRLKDDTPTWSLEEESCLGGIVVQKKKCKTANPVLFREQYFNSRGKVTGSWLALSVLTFGLMATRPPQIVVFNEESYREAVTDAKARLKTEFEDDDLTIVNLLTQYKLARSRVDRAFFSIEKHVTVSDHSGFYKKGLINFDSLIEISRTPARGSESFRALLEPWIILDQQLSSQTHIQTDLFDISCLVGRWKGKDAGAFDFSLECPKEMTVTDNTLSIKAHATIYSKSFGRILPKTFKMQDQFLAFGLSGEIISLINLSNQFLTVNDITFHYNGEIASRHNLQLDIPPQSRIAALSLGMFPIDESRLTAGDITRDMSLKKSLYYGFCLKYTLKNGQKKQTLYQKKTYHLLDLLPKTGF